MRRAEGSHYSLWLSVWGDYCIDVDINILVSYSAVQLQPGISLILSASALPKRPLLDAEMLLQRQPLLPLLQLLSTE